MPIYEYDCAECGKRSEHLLKSMKAVPSKCPFCGSVKIEKAFSAFSVAREQRAAMPSEACSACRASGCPHSQG